MGASEQDGASNAEAFRQVFRADDGSGLSKWPPELRLRAAVT